MIFAGEMKVGQLTGFLSYVLQILKCINDDFKCFLNVD